MTMMTYWAKSVV